MLNVGGRIEGSNVEEQVANMLQLLSQSLLSDPNVRLEAEKSLQMINPPNATFLTNLMGKILFIPVQKDQFETMYKRIGQLDPNLRLMTCLWVKNFLKKQWKQSNLYAEHEKMALRKILLHAAIYEPNETIALHLALILAQIARSDFPNQWRYEYLFPSLLEVLSMGPQDPSKTQLFLTQQRSIVILYRIIKELSTRRLMMHRKQFGNLSVQLLPFLLNFWHASLENTETLLINGWNQNLSPENKTKQNECLSIAITSTKLISTLVLNAFRELMQAQIMVPPSFKLVETQNQTQTQMVGEFFVCQTFEQMHQHLEKLLSFRETIVMGILQSSLNNSSQQFVVPDLILSLVDKCTYRMGKFIVESQKSYPMEFRSFLIPFLTLFWKILTLPNYFERVLYDNGSETKKLIQHKMLLECIQFFSNVLSCHLYKVKDTTTTGTTTSLLTKVITAQGNVTLTDAMIQEAFHSIEVFFFYDTTIFTNGSCQENRMIHLMQLVVEQYMRLTVKDLEEWQSDPEGYVLLQESLTRDESIHPCVENLFLTLIQNFPKETIPVLTQMIMQASSWLIHFAQNQQNLKQTKEQEQQILLVDAILLALGLSCYDLHDTFDFEPWFLQHLVPVLMLPEMQQVAGLPILRIRIVWLVSCWLAQLSSSIRAPLYDALLNEIFFAKEQDAALKLRILQTLESMLNDWGYEQQVFVPFLPRALACLYAFFPQAQESESKMKILSCLEAIVQVLAGAPEIMVWFEQICAPLPQVWTTTTSGGPMKESEDGSGNLIRGKILHLFSKLICAAKESLEEAKESKVTTLLNGFSSLQKVVEMCLQVVEYATNIENPEEVYLMEAGLELWREIVQLFLLFVTKFSQQNDNKCYYTEKLHDLFQNALNLMQRDYEHVKIVLCLIDLYLQLGQQIFWKRYHTQIAQLFCQLIGQIKAEACIQLTKTLEVIVYSSPSDQLVCLDTFFWTKIVEACVLFVEKNPMREPEMVIVGYLSVLTRLMMPQHLAYFMHVIPLSHLVLIIDLILDKFFTVVSTSIGMTRRKVWAAALVSLLSLRENFIYERIGRILDVCSEVLEQEKLQKNFQEESIQNIPKAFRHHQDKAQQKQDPIHQISLKAFIRDQLQHCNTSLGPQRFQQLLATIDQSILQQLQL